MKRIIAFVCLFALSTVGAAAQSPVVKKPVTKLTVTQAQANPLALLQQFTVADLQAAIADAQQQNPADSVAIGCYTAIMALVQTNVANPLPAGPGLFQAVQKARDAKSALANLTSPTGPLQGLNNACAAIVMDAQSTLLALGVTVGLVANPVGGTAALAGLPAGIAAFLALPKL